MVHGQREGLLGNRSIQHRVVVLCEARLKPVNPSSLHPHRVCLAERAVLESRPHRLHTFTTSISTSNAALAATARAAAAGASVTTHPAATTAVAATTPSTTLRVPAELELAGWCRCRLPCLCGGAAAVPDPFLRRSHTMVRRGHDGVCRADQQRLVRFLFKP